MNLVTDGGMIGLDDEGSVDENERTGVSGGGGEWNIFNLYAKRTCFSLVVK